MGVTVKDLLRKPFMLRGRDKQLQIILGGKPRPKKFKAEYYEKEQWLTACEGKNAFFCWSCLLFAADTSSAWNTVGFSDCNRVYAAFDEHKSAQAHINGVLKLQMFLNENFVEVDIPTAVNARVKKNREVVKRLVDVLCHVAAVKSPISGSTSTCEQHITEDCVEYLSLLKTYDVRDSCSEAINLIVSSPRILTDIVRTLLNLVTLEIKKEVKASSHVSLILSEHSEIDLKAKISSVLRYIKDGKVHERFIGFSHFIACKSVALMENHILGIIAKFEIGRKLFALSCDGSVLPNRLLKALIAFFRVKIPGFQLLPSHYHDFDFVIEQSLSGFHECRLFFQNLRSIKSYLQGSSKIRKDFSSFMRTNIPNLCDLKLSDSNFLRVLRLHRRDFINFFTGVENNFAEYSADEVARASGFASVLAELQTVFLLETFYVLFGHTAIFTETLSSSYPENVFEHNCITDIKIKLTGERESGFFRVWSRSLAEISDELEKPTREHLEHTNRVCFFLFDKITDHLMKEMDVRLKSLEKLDFFHILNFEHLGKFVVCEKQIKNLVATFHRQVVNETLLRNELKVINSNNSMLWGNSIYQFLETLVSMNLHPIFKNVVRLTELVLTMPCKPLSSTGDSKFDTIKAWATVVGNGSILDELSILSVEKDILQYVKSQDKFYDDFMNIFQKQYCTLQVI